MGKVWLKRAKSYCLCTFCYFYLSYEDDCGYTHICIDNGEIFTKITEAQFNATQGIKYSIKGGERTEI